MRAPDLFVDVGSNIGLYSLIAASYNTKRIYAFDAQYLCSSQLAESAKVVCINLSTLHYLIP